MNTLRGTWRLFRLITHLIKGLLLSYTRLRDIPERNLTKKQHEIIRTWLHQAAEIIGVDIQVRGTPSKRTVFVVANHVSWLDILIIASVLPVSFLSKEEVRDWPVIGTLAAKAGTLFIHRGSRDGAEQATKLIQKKLVAGHSVASFPEAKTTDGTTVHAFHPRLFAAAIETGVPIQPVALRYPHVRGVNSIVPYVDEPNLIKHAFHIMSVKCTVAEVSLCTLISSKRQTRKEVAKSARNAIIHVLEHPVSCHIF